MYLRRTQRRRKDGSVVGYLQLAHNRRVDRVTQAEVLLNLGREDQLEVEGLRRLARSIARYTDAADGVGAVDEAAGAELRVTDARAFGAAFVLDALWRRLGVGRAVGKVLSERRHRHDAERALFALVANRAIRPESKLAAAEWATHDAAIPGLGGLEAQHAYRAMDVLASADAEGAVQEAVFFSVADLLNLEVDLLFFDTTSSYFEIEDEDDEGDGGGEALRRFGHSKDHRPDRPQVVIGLAVTRSGIPVRVWVWPGNTADQAVVSEVKDDLAGWRLGRAVWVVDRGLLGAEPALPAPRRRSLDRRAAHALGRARLRGGAAAPGPLPRGRGQPARQGGAARRGRLRAALHRLPQPRGTAARPRARQERALERIETELERIERLRARSGRTGTAHERAECALRDHPSYSRYLRQLPSGRLRIDRQRVAAEERLDGKFLLETSDPDITAEDAALGYKNLLEAERSFRDLKGTLRIRPVFHRLEQRIRAHVLICWLALLLVRIAERETGESWRRLRTELERLKLVTLTGQAGTVEQTTPLSDAQRNILAALDIPPPRPSPRSIRPEPRRGVDTRTFATTRPNRAHDAASGPSACLRTVELGSWARMRRRKASSLQ